MLRLNKTSFQPFLKIYKSVPLYPGDWLSIILVLVFIIFLFQQYWFNPLQTGLEFVTIQVGNQTPQLYQISKNQELVINGALGPSRIEIKNGRVHFVHSPCQNKQCISHGWISKAGETVACLPNRISVSLSGRESRFDALNF